MKITVSKIPGVMNRGMFLVKVGSTEIGLLRKLPDTRTERHPWQAWQGVGVHRSFLGSWYPAEGGKASAIKAILSEGGAR